MLAKRNYGLPRRISFLLMGGLVGGEIISRRGRIGGGQVKNFRGKFSSRIEKLGQQR